MLHTFIVKLKHSPFLLIGLGSIICIASDLLWLIKDALQLPGVLYFVIGSGLLISLILISIGVYRGYMGGFLNVEHCAELANIKAKALQKKKDKIFK